MKTVTLWSVPVEVAKIAAASMRTKAAEMLEVGAETQDVYNLLYTVTEIEEAVKKVEAEDDDD